MKYFYISMACSLRPVVILLDVKACIQTSFSLYKKYLQYAFSYSRIILHRRDIYPLINSFSIFPLPLLSPYQPLKTTLRVLQMRRVFFPTSLSSFLWKERLRCLERQYAFSLLENSYVIVFAKISSHEMLLNIFLNVFNIQLQDRK